MELPTSPSSENLTPCLPIVAVPADIKKPLLEPQPSTSTLAQVFSWFLVAVYVAASFCVLVAVCCSIHFGESVVVWNSEFASALSLFSAITLFGTVGASDVLKVVSRREFIGVSCYAGALAYLSAVAVVNIRCFTPALAMLL